VSTNEDRPGVSETAIRASVRAFVLETFYVAADQQLHDDTSLLQAGIVDSTGVLEMIQFLESRFGLHVEDDEILPENLDSVNRIVAYVSQKVTLAAG